MKSSSHLSMPYAGFGRRFVAFVIDGLFISVITMAFQSLLGQNPFTILALIDKPEEMAALRSQPTYIISQISTYAIYALYLLIFWLAYDGATPGKRISGIRIVREGNNRMTFPAALVRIIGMVISGIPVGLGYLWAIWDRKKQTWHDKLAQTYVVRTDAKPNTLAMVLLFIIAILYQVGMIVMGVTAGFLIAKDNISQVRQNRESVANYNASVEALPPEAKKHFDRSQELFAEMREKSGDRNAVIRLNDENIRELTAALEIAPDNARLWTDLGAAYTWVSSKGTLEDGLKAYGKAEELEPDNVIYITNVGDMLIRLGKNQDAVLQLQKALRKNANYAQPEYLIGVAYKNMKIYDQAKTHLESAIAIWEKQNDNGQFDDEILNAQQELAAMPK